MNNKKRDLLKKITEIYSNLNLTILINQKDPVVFLKKLIDHK